MIEHDQRSVLIPACRQINALGINQGKWGNITVRHGEMMLILPSAPPHDQIKPDMVGQFAGYGLQDESVT